MPTLSFGFSSDGFRSVRGNSPDPCSITKAFCRTFDCALTAITSSSPDALPAAPAYTIRFRRLQPSVLMNRPLLLAGVAALVG